MAGLFAFRHDVIVDLQNDLSASGGREISAVLAGTSFTGIPDKIPIH